jgi:hypothetical protein
MATGCADMRDSSSANLLMTPMTSKTPSVPDMIAIKQTSIHLKILLWHELKKPTGSGTLFPT